MAQTSVNVNDPMAVKRYSAFLAVDTARKSYFNKKFMGGPDASTPITRLVELENAEGEYISFDLSVQIGMQPIEGDDVLEGKETALKFYSDGIYIDQMRGGVNTGGRMSRKRTIHDLRKVARNRQSDWWARIFDELFFMYLAGDRGVNTEFNFPADYSGFANNPMQSPDEEHYFIAGGYDDPANLTATDRLTLDLIDQVKTTAQMMGGAHEQTPQVMPIMVDGEKHYVCLMNPWQAYYLRTSTSTNEWMELRKAAAGAEGTSSPIFKGGLGMYNNVVLHEHEAVIRFDTSTHGAKAARAMFMGEQAGVIAFGSPGSGLRFNWHEESRDNGNQVIITTSSILGVKKTNFNGKDYGIMCIDSSTDKE